MESRFKSRSAEEIFALVAADLDGGVGPRSIVADFMQLGWTEKAAYDYIARVEQAMVQHRQEVRRIARKSAAWRHMVAGGAIFGIGLLLTLATAGRWIFTGALALGVVQFLYGAVGYVRQSSK